jgi:ArsR family transcriptional regulator
MTAELRQTGSPVLNSSGANADTDPYAACDATHGDATNGDAVELFADDADIERASRSLKAMSHPLRLKILCTLGDEEVSVQDIVEHVGTSQSNISQHLAILRDKGILASRKDANRVYYRVGDSRTLQLIGMMREVFCHQGH